jgi:type IV secretion system protein VirB3
MRRDVLFRGCTRPAMFLGVPYVPFFIGAGTCLLLAVYINLLLLVLVPLVILGMRQMARRDEMVFRLLGLRWQFRARVRNRRLRNGDWSFAPIAGRDIGMRR